MKSSDYKRIPDLLSSGEILTDRAKHFVTIASGGEKPWMAVIKVTASGKGAWLQSMRRTNDADIARIRGRSELVREAKK